MCSNKGWVAVYRSLTKDIIDYSYIMRNKVLMNDTIDVVLVSTWIISFCNIDSIILILLMNTIKVDLCLS